MKYIHLPMLSLLLAGAAQAADLSPNSLGPLANVSDSLLQKPLQFAEYSLGLDFIQGQTQDDRYIQRRFNLAIGLPADTELGFTAQDTQEGGAEAPDHAAQSLGGRFWLRWNMLQSSLASVALTLQYQPGMSDQTSAYQASQDRTSLGLDVKFQPIELVNAAVYGTVSRRQDERFHDLALGQETQAGLRFAVGSQSYGVFGDFLQRHLDAKDRVRGESKKLFARQSTAGLYLGFETVQLSAFTMIPDANRYPGVPERAYGLSLAVRIGGSETTSERPLEDAIAAVDRADREAAAKTDKAPAEGPVKMLETNEPDEFQLLDKREQEAARNQKESANEKAERQLREGLEADKKREAQQAVEHEKAQKAAAADAMNIGDSDRKTQQYKDEIESEINAYTLPDQEDMNWNGLLK